MPGSAHGDRELVKRMLAGEEHAFSEFFDGYFPRLYRFALGWVDQDADAAEEVVQATLCKAVTVLSTYRGEAALFTWLCTFCRHEIGAYHSRRRRQPQSVGLIQDSPEVHAALDSRSGALAPRPDDDVQREEMGRLVHVALDSLPGHYADALEWKYIHELSVESIAGRLKVGPKAAESLLARARVAFRDAFETLAGRTCELAPWTTSPKGSSR